MILPDVSPVSNTGTGKPLVNGQTSSEVSLDLSWSPGRSGGLASFFVRGISGSWSNVPFVPDLEKWIQV